MTVNTSPQGPGLFSVARGGAQPVITNIRRLAGRELDTGARLIAGATGALAVLGAGLLAVSYAAQRQYLFGARHENWPSVIEALSLDLAMLIFAMLALGLARKGLPARAERAAVVVCAAGSAFMNYLAADVSSPRSVAAYVMPPILLALAADRVIAVARRWVLGQQATEASVWRSTGRGLGLAALYTLRLLADFRATRAGIHHAILAAAPLPGEAERPAEHDALDVTAVLREELATGLERIRHAADVDVSRLREELAHHQAHVSELLDRQARLELAAGASAYPTKKAHLVALYREHADYGVREAAGRVAGELAARAGLQAGTARAYVYQELAELAGHSEEAGIHRQAGAVMASGRSKDGK